MKKRAIVIALSLALLLSVFVPGTLAMGTTETETDTTTVVSQPDTEVLAADGEGTRSGDEQTDLTDGETVTGDGQTTDEDSVTGDGQTTDQGAVTGDGQTTDQGTVTGDGQTTEEGTVTGDGQTAGEGTVTDDGQTVDEGNVTGDGQTADPTEATAATDPTETTAATDPTETTVPETTVPETTVPETIVPVSHWEGCADGCEKEDCDCLCHVYDRIMACTTLEEIYAILDSYTDEELETLAMALTQEQNAEIEAKITALEPEPLPPVVLEESTDEPVESEIIYVTVNYANVAPFGEPVSG